jgi:hypothetical protein
VNSGKVKIYIPDFNYHKNKVRNSSRGVVKFKGCEITRKSFTKKNSSKSKRFEPQEFKSRSQHQYEGSKRDWDDDSVSIDMESYLSYSI